MLEETGLTINDLKVGPWRNDIFHDENKHYITLYLISKFETGEPKVLEPDKCAEWIWMKLSEIPKPQFKPLENLLLDGFNTEKLLSYFK